MSNETPTHENQQRSFARASSLVQKQFSLEVLTRKWNATGLGKPAGETTILRWLSLGPDTKNPRFEPWVIGLASVYL